MVVPRFRNHGGPYVPIFLHRSLQHNNSHTEPHDTTNCCVVRYVWEYCCVSYLSHNATICCVARSGNKFATEVEMILWFAEKNIIIINNYVTTVVASTIASTSVAKWLHVALWVVSDNTTNCCCVVGVVGVLCGSCCVVTSQHNNSLCCESALRASV